MRKRAGLNGNELTVLQIMENLKAKRHQRQVIIRQIVYSKQEVKSARAVLDRLLELLIQLIQ